MSVSGLSSSFARVYKPSAVAAARAQVIAADAPALLAAAGTIRKVMEGSPEVVAALEDVGALKGIVALEHVAAKAGAAPSGDKAPKDEAEVKTANELKNYIPGDVLSLYLGLSSAIASLSHFAGQAGNLLDLTGPYRAASLGAYAFCIVVAPFVAWISSLSTYPKGIWPPWQAWAWPAISGMIAFAVYGLMVPGTWLSVAAAGIVTPIVVIIVTLLLAQGGKAWLHFVPVPGGNAASP